MENETVILGTGGATTHYVVFEKGAWKATYNIVNKLTFDLKTWRVREIEMILFGESKEEVATTIQKNMYEYLEQFGFDLFNIKEFDGEREEKYA
jgi:hypothetical protein